MDTEGTEAVTHLCMHKCTPGVEYRTPGLAYMTRGLAYMTRGLAYMTHGLKYMTSRLQSIQYDYTVKFLKIYICIQEI